MMDPVRKALDEVKFRIPRAILEEVFIKRLQTWSNGTWNMAATNVDNEILSTVIRPRVMVDCNLLGGMQAFIPLAGVPYVQPNLYTSVYRIPKTLTQGRLIIAALNITFNDPTNMSNYGTMATSQTSISMQVGQAVMDAQGAIPLTSTADVQLIGENTIMVRDLITMPTNCYLRCQLALDENLNHLQLGSYRAFSKMVLYAVEAFIYNELIIKMGSGELQGGQVLGVFKERIDAMSDANQNYDDYLKDVMQKVLIMNDQQTNYRLLKMAISGNR